MARLLPGEQMIVKLEMMAMDLQRSTRAESLCCCFSKLLCYLDMAAAQGDRPSRRQLSAPGVKSCVVHALTKATFDSSATFCTIQGREQSWAIDQGSYSRVGDPGAPHIPKL